MGKFVNDTHVVGERGVLQFHQYCNSHNPYICFREVLRNDFGIDGEVELVRINEDEKKEMTGELLKVQIKSSFGNGYIKKRIDGTFSFFAKKGDLEYWSRHELGVLLIIYDDSTGNLYAKKIRLEDYAGAKKKSYPIDFGEENRLETEKNDFVTRFSSNFRSRVSFETSEQLITNLLHIKQHPRTLYIYDSKYSSKRNLFEDLNDPNEAPYFLLYGKKIVTPYRIEKDFSIFYKLAVQADSVLTIIEFNEIIRNATYRRYLSEILNLIFKDFAARKGIFFNKDYKRYYFNKPRDSDERTIDRFSKLTDQITQKKVVSYHEYGKLKFYRHVAFETDFIFSDKQILLEISPKYLFTENGKITLSPKNITKYTNFLTAREWNAQVVEQLSLLLNYLRNCEGGVEVVSTQNIKVSLSNYIPQLVNFGIPFDLPARKTSKKKMLEEKENIERSKQLSLL